MGWNELKMIHEMCDEPDYSRDGFGLRAGDAGMAYQEGYRKGFSDAMREVSGRSGYREGYRNDGSRGSYMGERRMPGFPEPPVMDFREHYDPMDMRDYDDMGERRRRDSRGRYM